jgi:hypothetical protein
MTNTQPNLLQLAKQGNARAIAILLNRSLQPKGIAARASFKDGCLQIMLESAQVPDQLVFVNFIYKGITNLGSEVINTVKVYGRKVGEEFPAWNQVFDLSGKSSHESESTVIQSVTPSPVRQAIENNSQEHTIQSKPKAYTSNNQNRVTPNNGSLTSSLTKTINTKSQSSNSKYQTTKKNNDYGHLFIKFIIDTLRNWTLRKTGYVFLVVGGFILLSAIPSCSSGSVSGISTVAKSLVLFGIGAFFHKLASHRKAEKSLSALAKESIKELKQKYPSIDVVQPNEFGKINNLNFAITGVFYDNAIIAGYEKQHLGSVAVGDENWATATSITSKTPVYAEITGKGVVIEIIVQNLNKTNTTVSHQDFYLVDQHHNRYSKHPQSDYVSALRSGITKETNLRPEMKAKYFAVFDVNSDSVALMLTTSPESLSEEKVVFSLDLEQKILRQNFRLTS